MQCAADRFKFFHLGSNQVFFKMGCKVVRPAGQLERTRFFSDATKCEIPPLRAQVQGAPVGMTMCRDHNGRKQQTPARDLRASVACDELPSVRRTHCAGGCRSRDEHVRQIGAPITRYSQYSTHVLICQEECVRSLPPCLRHGKVRLKKLA